MSDSMVSHWDACLGCMACVTACPSGVQYDTLIEQTRAQVERRHERPAADKALRGADLLAVPAPEAAAAGARAAARLPAHRPRPARCGAPACWSGWRRSWPRWRASRPGWASRSTLPRAHPGDRRAPRGRRPADRLRAGRVLPGRQRRHRAGAAGRGLRRRRARGSRAAAARCRCTTAARPRRRASPAASSTPSRRPASSASWSTPPAAARR